MGLAAVNGYLRSIAGDFRPASPTTSPWNDAGYPICARHVGSLSLPRCPPTPPLAAGSALAVRHVAEIPIGPVGSALVQWFGPRQAHVAFRRIRRRAGSELLNGGAALISPRRLSPSASRDLPLTS